MFVSSTLPVLTLVTERRGLKKVNFIIYATDESKKDLLYFIWVFISTLKISHRFS